VTRRGQASSQVSTALPPLNQLLKAAVTKEAGNTLARPLRRQGHPKHARRDLGNLSESREKARDPYHRRHCPARQRTTPPGRLSRTKGRAMGIRWQTRQYERTCDDCGHAWRVPKWAAPLQIQGRSVCGGGERGVPPPAAAVIGETVVATTAQLAETAAAVFRRCHECGSEHYKQRSIWSWTDDPASPGSEST
jgi:hypothetical protein